MTSHSDIAESATRGHASGASLGSRVPRGTSKSFWEDYVVGERLVGASRTMTEPDVILYSMFSGDWDRQLEGTRVVVPDTFAFCVGLCLLQGAGRNHWLAESFIAFYGFDRIDFVQPVCVGDTITSHVTVLDVIERDERRGVVVFDHSTEDQRGRKILGSQHRAIFGRRPERGAQ